jgi:hypothetical protein
MPEIKKRNIKKKTWRWLKITAGVFLLILVLAHAFLFFYISPIVERLAKEAVYNHSEHLYSLSFRKFSFSLFGQSITVKDMYLKPDTVLYRQIKNQGPGIADLYTVYVPELKIDNVELYEAIFEDFLEIDEIFVREPELLLVHDRQVKVKKKPKKKLEMRSLTSSKFSSLSVHKINMENASLKYLALDTFSITPIGIHNISLHVTNLRISDADTGNVQYADDAELVLKDYGLNMPGGMYALKINTVKVKPLTSSIELDSLTYTPRHGKYKHGEVKGYQDDRMNIRVKKVNITNIDLPAYLDHRSLHAGKVSVDGIALYDFRDKNLPPSPYKINKLPHVRLQDLSSSIIVDTIKVTNGFLLYEEHAEGADAPGSMKFSELNLTATNITNDSASLVKNAVCNINLNAMLMGTTKLNASFNFDLDDPNGKFFCSGTLGKLDVRELNAMLEPATRVRLDEGMVDRADFSISANDHFASGVLNLHYHDLKIKITDDEASGIKRRLGSLAINKLFVKSGNPDKGEPLRKGRIFYRRDRTKAIFNFCWKALFSGIASTLGIADEMEKQAAKVQEEEEKERRQLTRDRRKEIKQKLRQEKKSDRQKIRSS